MKPVAAVATRYCFMMNREWRVMATTSSRFLGGIRSRSQSAIRAPSFITKKRVNSSRTMPPRTSPASRAWPAACSATPPDALRTVSRTSDSSSSTFSCDQLRGSPWAHSLASSTAVSICSPRSPNWEATLAPIHTRAASTTARAPRKTVMAASDAGHRRRRSRAARGSSTEARNRASTTGTTTT